MSTDIDTATEITMTEEALAHVRSQISRRGSGIGIRLGVKRVGCSGLAYVLDFLDAANDEDHEFQVDDGISVFVDPEHYPYVKGTRLNYGRQGLNEGFEFYNPNAKDQCGCGESFNV